MALAQGSSGGKDIIYQKNVMTALQDRATRLGQSKGRGDIGIPSGSVDPHLAAGVSAFYQEFAFQGHIQVLSEAAGYYLRLIVASFSASYRVLGNGENQIYPLKIRGLEDFLG